MNSKKIQIVMVGTGGYGEAYLSAIRGYYDNPDNPLVLKAVVDPFVSSAPSYEWIVNNKIPMYDTLKEFYLESSADLALIATPIPLHKEHCLCAMENGSNVLCEKPLVATVQDAMELKAAQVKYNVKFAVGFQWSYSSPILNLKKNIMSGIFGKPLLYKGFSTSNRSIVYFDHPWKGRYKDADGRWCLDCVISNATSHYLHNLFFLKGSAIDEASLPKEVFGELYRAKPDMQMPDIAAIKGVFDDGCPFLYTTSYSLKGKSRTQFYLKFEKADVLCDLESTEAHIIAEFHDGKTVDFGNPNGLDERMRKLDTMLNVLRSSDIGIPCKLETAIPHVKVCNGLFDYCHINQVSDEFLTFGDEPSQTAGSSIINDDLYEAYLENKLPSEMGFKWSGKSGSFKLEDINGFKGLLIPGI